MENLKEWREIYRDYLYYSAALRSHINNFEIAKLEEAGGTYLTVLDEAEVLENPNLTQIEKRLFFILSSYLLFSLDSFQLSMNSLIDSVIMIKEKF